MNTDLELRQAVERELAWDPGIDVRHVAVAAKNGVITLTGTVGSFHEKWRAESIAKRVAGVAAVANDIRVNLLSERTDSDIAEAAALALGVDDRIPTDRIKVAVKNGWIELEGQFDYYFQKSAAESAVRNLAGVKGIRNWIVVTPPVVLPAEVKSKIEEALERSAEVDAMNINVETRGNKVILAGTVRSWAEREEAERAAWRAPGISEVDNRLEVRI